MFQSSILIKTELLFKNLSYVRLVDQTYICIWGNWVNRTSVLSKVKHWFFFCSYDWKELSVVIALHFVSSINRYDGQFSSVQFSCSVVSYSLWPHELQHARPPCPSPTPGVYSNPCLSSRWCHPTISSSVIPFSSCPQSLPASGSFPMSQLSATGGQSIGVSASASVLPMNTQDWSPSGWTGWISLQSKGFSRVFSNITAQ